MVFNMYNLYPSTAQSFVCDSFGSQQLIVRLFPLLINTIFCITKQYIYAKKCMGEPLIFTQLTSKIHEFREIEYVIAKKNGT